MEKIKKYIAAHKREFVFGAVLFFVASLSFGLGYAACRQFYHATIVIEQCSKS